MSFRVGIVFGILICCFFQLNYACVATSSASSPTTAAPATTTTTASSVVTTSTTTTAAVTTTTTTSALACSSCTAGQVTLTPGNVAQGTETPTATGPTTGTDGCVTLVVTCPATNTGPIFMQFNGNLGGPTDPNGAQVNATLVCVNGNWTFTQNGVTTIITEVNCVAA
uniref:C6 domain-containing protein n=1 Tax=Panagrolaimus sp. JU765 TaxID=591449 RepID=A0AC34RFM4_9BILA